VKIEINPARWFRGKAGVAMAAPVAVANSETGSSAKAVETMMATTAVTPAPAENGFERFIDKIGQFFKKDAPIIEGFAVAAEPFLALTPFGPEYALVVNAIIGVQKTATASLSTGASLTGAQKMALVLEAASPGLTAILASKQVTSGVPAAISQFAQNVYNLQTGPVTTVAPTAAKPATPAA